MPTCLDSVIDHVAVAVPDREYAERRWRDQLGGGRFNGADNGVFRFAQLRYRNGAKLELLEPSRAGGRAGGPDTFLQRFLKRFGSQIHHVTLKVEDLPGALRTMEANGLKPVDVDAENPYWQEAFLRPSQVGGLVVQVAASPYSDEEWMRRSGSIPEPPAAHGALLLGPHLRHPDLEAATALWAVLGAGVERSDGRLVCRWPRSPLEVLIEHGEPAGPVSLRMRNTAALPAEEGLGPAVSLA